MKKVLILFSMCALAACGENYYETHEVAEGMLHLQALPHEPQSDKVQVYFDNKITDKTEIVTIQKDTLEKLRKSQVFKTDTTVFVRCYESTDQQRLLDSVKIELDLYPPED